MSYESKQAILSGKTYPLLILYASQTGTAARFAKILGNFARSRNFAVTIKAMDDYKDDLAKEKLVLFVCASYGNGEYPDNAIQFSKMLHDKEDREWLKNLSYSVFGLGNSKFPIFNRAAKDLSDVLAHSGARQLVTPAFGDEVAPNGHEDTFHPWMASLWSVIAAGPMKPSLLSDYTLTPHTGAAPSAVPLPRGFTEVKILSNTRLTPADYERATHLLKFSCPFTYNLCDHVSVCAANSDESVARALKCMHADGDAVYDIKPTVEETADLKIPTTVSLFKVFKYYLAINDIPSRALLDSLSCACTDEAEKKKLSDLAADMSPDNEYIRQQSSRSFTVMDVLEQYKSIKIDLAQFITNIPRLQSRVYSIACDPMSNKDSFELVVVRDITKFRTTGQTVTGVASNYLCSLPVGHTVWVKKQPGMIVVPEDIARPLVMVALGSGIAPIRGIVQHRVNLLKSGKKPAKCLMYYGVRHETKDFLFRNEFNDAIAAGAIELVPVFSYDQEKFITVSNLIDEDPAKLYKYLEPEGVYIYCGIGGTVPELVSKSVIKAIQTAGNVTRYKASTVFADLRDAVPCRCYIEAFAKDIDAENAIKGLSSVAKRQEVAYKSEPVASHFDEANMFCWQCEQTFAGEGCYKSGVCGKTPDVANLQDMLVHGTRVMSWYCHNIRLVAKKHNDTDCEDAGANRFTFDALFSTLTNVNFDEVRFLEYLQECRSHIRNARDRYLKICRKYKEQYHDCPISYDDLLPPDEDLKHDIEGSMKFLNNKAGRIGILDKLKKMDNDDLVGVQELIIYGLKGVSAYAGHALILGCENNKIYADMHAVMAALMEPEGEDLNKALGLALEVGRINYDALTLLYQANTKLGTPSPHTVPVKPKVGKAILVSGHDLGMMYDLLEQIRNTPGAENVYVYTHGEMLPAHGYPKLREHPNMGNHFGAAWQRQSIEFKFFPGPILMTTNCLTPPKPNYKERVFTVSVVGFKGVKHLESNRVIWGPNSGHDFSSIIKMAMDMPGFTAEDKDFNYPVDHVAPRPESLTVGYGHEAVLGAAPVVIDAIKRGLIKRFVVIGGCDGYEGERNYFTDLARTLPDDAVILTCGCGKYKVNILQYPTIGDTGIPKLLDVGQCNDSWSCVQIALALASVLKCEVKDLPLSIVLSWFEQKAVADLLMLLYLKLSPIRIGPQLPAFIRPGVLNILATQFGVKPVSAAEVKRDVELMMNAKGMAEDTQK